MAATIDSLVWTPAGRFHMWSGASQSLERFRLLKYRGLGANVHVARSHVLILYTRYPIVARAWPWPLGRVRARAKVSCIQVLIVNKEKKLEGQALIT